MSEHAVLNLHNLLGLYMYRTYSCHDIFPGVDLGFLPGGGRDIFRGGGETNSARPPSPERFLLSYTTLLIYAHFFFFILDTCDKKIPKIMFLETSQLQS